MMELGTTSNVSENIGDTDQRASLLLNETSKEHLNDGDIGITDESTVNQLKRPKLSIDVPPRHLQGSSLNFVAINMPTSSASANSDSQLTSGHTSANTPISACVHVQRTPSSIKARSSMKKLVPKISFKDQSKASEHGKDGSQVPEASTTANHEKPSILRSVSFTKIFSPAVRRTSSLPVTTLDQLHDRSLYEYSIAESLQAEKEVTRKNIHRSLSVPLNTKCGTIKRTNSLGGVFRVIPSPRVKDISGSISRVESDTNGDAEDIPEEEAVCRICLIELSEGSDTLKLECSCKGELALAHHECAVKWFSIKGNSTCDVCQQEVRNLPVTLLRIRSARVGGIQIGGRLHPTVLLRMCQDIPILVIISMLAYFCFLEELLQVKDNGPAALPVSLPFSCILGLSASVTASTMVRKWYIWLYASVQFLLVVVFAHVFFLHLHIRPIMSIVLATFAGFGITMSVSSIIVEFLRWRTQWLHRRHNQEILPTTQSSNSITQSQQHTSQATTI